MITIGIAHYGQPMENPNNVNSHDHLDKTEKIALVHNGIY